MYKTNIQNCHYRTSKLLRLAQRHARLSTSSTSSVNPEEIALFSRLSDQWWDERGEFGLLHKMNPVRMQFVRDKLLETAREESEETLPDDDVDLPPQDQLSNASDFEEWIDLGDIASFGN